MINPIHGRVLLVTKRHAGSWQAFSIRFHALRAYRAFFCAFELLSRLVKAFEGQHVSLLALRALHVKLGKCAD
jgi:hypothetical protein